MDSAGCSLILLLLFSVCLLRQAEAQTGFINLACGAPTDLAYIDRHTGLKYTSDANFIDTGVSESMKEDTKRNTLQQYWNVRAFPDGIRSCYRFKLSKGHQYFIRAFVKFDFYVYNESPAFHLYLGPHIWAQVFDAFQNLSLVSRWEMLHLQNSGHLHVCLVKTGSSIPFISVLEIREVEKAPYTAHISPLRFHFRQDLGSTTGQEIRFRDDPFDRQWKPYIKRNWKHINTTKDINTSNSFRPPVIVMRTASTPINPREDMIILYLNPTDHLRQFDIYLHVAELEEINSNEFREFEVFCNGKRLFGPFSPVYLKTTTIYVNTSAAELNENRNYTIYLSKTWKSTLPPLLNALEVYRVDIINRVETVETVDAEVDTMVDIKKTYTFNKTTWQGDPCAPPNFTWDGVFCRESNKSFRITTLNLTGRGLTGRITRRISSLSHLETLDLSNNNLSGGIPSFLADMRALKVLNLVGNKFNSSIPESLRDKANKGILSLCIEGREHDCATTLRNKKRNGIRVAAIVSPLGILLALGGVMVGYFLRSWFPLGPFRSKAHLGVLAPTFRNNKNFSYSEILRITNNLERLIGKEGSGDVYQGVLNGAQVAVKIMNQSTHGYNQLKNEVELLTRVHHKNLATLVGYCVEKQKLALVYEFMANGNLQEHLSGRRGSKIFDWRTRLQIALQTAQGLEYLHNNCEPQIIHRNVKPANILLDEHLNAKLSDFGLSRAFTIEGQTHISTLPAGTPGYLDPEYHKTHKLTEKADVYSFGMTLLELVANRPMVCHSEESPDIKDWVESLLERGHISEVLDQNIQGNIDMSALQRFIEFAMRCTTMPPLDRPTMSDAVLLLRECLAIQTAKENEGNDGISRGEPRSVNVMSESTFEGR